MAPNLPVMTFLFAAVALGALGSVSRRPEHQADDAELRRRVEILLEAIRADDLDRVLSIYAPDIVSFDVEPPLQHVGAQAKRKNWEHVFATHQRPIGYDLRNLTLTVGDDVAFAHGLVHKYATLKDGTRSDVWLRWTACFEKLDGKWLITHDHVSAPFDTQTGQAALDLKPEP